MVTNREFLDACEVINTFCKEHNTYCGNCPMIGVCRVGIPDANLNNENELNNELNELDCKDCIHNGKRSVTGKCDMCEEHSQWELDHRRF